MATYSIKNISPTAVVWSSQTIQPNEAIDINYENLYDKTTDLGVSQDAMDVSTLAQEDKILLCVDGVDSTKEETLQFIREIHNKNSVLEIPTKFLPSKHSYNWEKDGDKLFHLESKIGFGTSEPDGKLHIKDGENINLKIGKLEHDDASNLGAGLTFTRTSSNSDLMGLGVLDVDKLGIMSRKGIIFFTGGNSSYKNTQEVMRINELGEICMGDNYLTGAKLLIEERTNPQLQLKNLTNRWDFRVGDTGDLILKSSSVEKLRLKENGGINLANSGESNLDIEDTNGQKYRIFARNSDKNLGFYDATNNLTFFRYEGSSTASNSKLRLLEGGGELLVNNKSVVTESPYFTDGLVDYNSDITHTSFTSANLSYSVSKSGYLDFYGYCYTSSLSNNSTYILNTGNPLPVYLRPKSNKYFSCQCWGSTKTNAMLMIISSSTGFITLYTRDKGWNDGSTIFVPINTNYQIQG